MIDKMPEGFVPLVVIGEQDELLVVMTAETHEETQMLLEDAWHLLQEQDVETIVKH
jgi:hypothetical protein